MNKNDGAYARSYSPLSSPQKGLSKLELISAMMMQSMIASSTQSPEACAKESLVMAKALIDELNAEKE